MNCSGFGKSIYLYEELTPSQRRDLDEHSTTCMACSKLAKEVFQSRTLIKKISVQRPQVQNTGQLTQRIMDAIEKEKRVSWLDRIVSYLDSYFVRYAFSVVSLFLISWFVYEQQYSEYKLPIVKTEAIEIKQGTVLDMNAFSNTYLKLRESKEARSSFSGYAYYKSEWSQKNL
jgi:hypothetical protein